MTFGEPIALQRKQLKMSQDELAKIIGTSAPIIGRCERNEIKPSIEVAAKIAEALDTSLDYLVGNSDAVLEKTLVKKITDIQKLSADDKNVVIKLIDAFLRDTTAKKAYAS